MHNLTAFMFGSPPEWILIAVVVLIIFGPKKLPEFARSIGKSVGELKKGIDESKETFNQAMHAEPAPVPAAVAASATPAVAPTVAPVEPEHKLETK